MKLDINQSNKSLDHLGILPNTDEELVDVYAPFDFQHIQNDSPQKEMRIIDAISDGLKHAMVKHLNLILMGQDIAEYGVFKITDGFVFIQERTE